MATLITGLFRKRVAAEAAVEVILKRGILRENIGVLLSDATKNKELAIAPDTRAAAGAGIGAAIGAAVGTAISSTAISSAAAPAGGTTAVAAIMTRAT